MDEIKETGLTPLTSDLVKAPRVAESPVNMECRLNQIVQFGKSPEFGCLIIGEVVRMHIKDEFCVNGELDGIKLKNIGRLWGKYYCRISDIFEMPMPGPYRE